MMIKSKKLICTPNMLHDTPVRPLVDLIYLKYTSSNIYTSIKRTTIVTITIIMMMMIKKKKKKKKKKIMIIILMITTTTIITQYVVKI